MPVRTLMVLTASMAVMVLGTATRVFSPMWTQMGLLVSRWLSSTALAEMMSSFWFFKMVPPQF